MHIPPSDLHVRIPAQDEIESAPQITFAQFRRLAKRREWSVEYLVAQCREEIDNPTDTIRRVMEGADGKRVRMDDAVIPYWPLIHLYLTRS
jgi:hypothetical protein